MVVICDLEATSEIRKEFSKCKINCSNNNYSVFHRFRQAKFAYGGSILSLSQFLLLPELPLKMKLASKVVKINSNIILSPQRSKSTKLIVEQGSIL